MNGRPRFRQLYAELAALPLASVNGFLHCFTRVPHQSKDGGVSDFDKAVSDFYAESESLAKTYSRSTNELADLRDLIWFGNKPAPKGNVGRQTGTLLSDYLKSLAKNVLEVRGSELRPRISSSDLRHDLGTRNQNRFARESLNWLGRELPVDLLEVSLARDFSTNQLSNRIERLLEKQFAEVHLHLGASINFDVQWRYLQGVLRKPDLQFDFLKTPHGFFERGTKFGTWVIVSATVRFLLAKFLVTSPSNLAFGEFLSATFRQLRAGGVNIELLRHCIASFYSPHRHEPEASQEFFFQLQSLYQQVAMPNVARPNSFNQLEVADPIRYYLKPRRVTCERRFATLALERINSYQGDNRDELFERLFWQTQRIRVLFYRHITQRQSIAGLVWFTRYYRRISPSRKGVVSDALQFIGGAINNGYGFGLKSLEVRGAPPKKADLVAPDVDQIRLGALALNTQPSLPPGSRKLESPNSGTGEIQFVPVEFEAGLVYHFIKARERGSADVLSVQGHDRHDQVTTKSVSKYRYGDYFAKLQRDAKATASAIRNFPLTLLWLRAVDVCNDELAIPTWLFRDAYQQIISASIETSQYLFMRFGQKVKPVRPNSHVGEDFSHLLTGLRRIDESLELLGISEGDRIGHGLALGTEPISWAENSGPVTMTNEQRLFDLIWARSVSGVGAEPSAKWDMEISRLINLIFDSVEPKNRPDFSAIERMCSNLADFSVLKRVGFPNEDPVSLQKEFQRRAQVSSLKNDEFLLFSFLTDRRIARAAASVLLVDPISEGRSLLALQDALRSKVAMRGVAVEVNPTSNLVVANYDDLSKHPMWRLNRPGYSDKIPPVSLCVGSDDPLVFATDLRQEYQRLSDALGQAGYSDVQIDKWLDRVREKSLEVRNTLSVTSFAPVTSIRRK